MRFAKYIVAVLALLTLALSFGVGRAHAQKQLSPANFMAATGDSCKPAQGRGGFVVSAFLFPPWYKYLDGKESDGVCRPDFDQNELGSTVTKIAAALIEFALHISALVAAGFIIYGSIQYIVSQGDPTGLSNAKNTITNAIIGLVIIVLASGIVQFIGNTIKT